MKSKIIIFLSATLILFSSCEDFLDRPQLSGKDDDNFWKTEADLRTYCNQYYAQYFIGYSTLWGGDFIDFMPMFGYLTNDDIMVSGQQRGLEITIPSSRGTTNFSTSAFLESYNGPTWRFSWARTSNILIERINTRMGFLSEEIKNHWLGIGHFYRGMEYANLARVFGDIPYFDREVGYSELDELYKPRTPRNEVMDKVYDDLKFAIANVRPSDGDRLNVNRYVVAAYICRLMLYEGTWQKYYYNNPERARKFFEFAIEAGDLVISSGNYYIQTDFRTLFGSDDLRGNMECIMYRHYDATIGTPVTHCAATYCNMNESNSGCANLDLVKAFICSDGQVYQASSLTNADKFDMTNLVATRDSRFEATFWNKPTIQKATSSGLYTCKFIDRVGPELGASGAALLPKYASSTNTNDAPVMRYAELLLNWIEAKAELATLGGAAVSQADINTSINAIRDRPLAAEAIAKGITKTAPMSLATLPNDPRRDSDVSPLIWEIRRERRMELFWEHARLIDLRRWKKIHYMDDAQNPDLLRGIWINIPVELPGELAISARKGVMAVVSETGEKTVFDGDNGAQMVGYYSPATVQPRRPFNISGVNVYLAPVGTNQIADYANRGYELKQTEGWGN